MSTGQAQKILNGISITEIPDSNYKKLESALRLYSEIKSNNYATKKQIESYLLEKMYILVEQGLFLEVCNLLLLKNGYNGYNFVLSDNFCSKVISAMRKTSGAKQLSKNKQRLIDNIESKRFPNTCSVSKFSIDGHGPIYPFPITNNYQEATTRKDNPILNVESLINRLQYEIQTADKKEINAPVDTTPDLHALITQLQLQEAQAQVKEKKRALHTIKLARQIDPVNYTTATIASKLIPKTSKPKVASPSKEPNKQQQKTPLQVYTELKAGLRKKQPNLDVLLASVEKTINDLSSKNRGWMDYMGIGFDIHGRLEPSRFTRSGHSWSSSLVSSAYADTIEDMVQQGIDNKDKALLEAFYYMEMSMIYSRTGDTSKALGHYRKIIEMTIPSPTTEIEHFLYDYAKLNIAKIYKNNNLLFVFDEKGKAEKILAELQSDPKVCIEIKKEASRV